MRKVTVIFAAIAAVAVAGCATLTVSSHIERGINFAEYVTYDWGPPDGLPVGDPRLDNNPFFNDYLQGAIEKKMAAKGYDRALAGGADLLIHYHASVNQKIDVYGVDHQYGYCYNNCEPQYSDYEEGTLVIDLVDTNTNKVVWRGWAQDSMNGIIDNQQRLEKQVDESVMKMMERLPRGGAALR
jgi:hypothetical protein